MTNSRSVFSGVEHAAYGPARTYKNMTVVPLLAAEDLAPDYHTLDEALAAGTIRVTEINERGSVPQLKVVNSGDAAVLLLDGEELIGAKQNRVVNLSILVPGHREVVIPVSCVEAGRWRHASAAFAAAPRTQFAEGRAARMAQVSRSIAQGGRASDQGAVWSMIADKSVRLGAMSQTAAMSAMFDKLDDSLDAFVDAFPVADQQAGAVFVIDDHIAGLEWFDSPSTWRKLAPKLLRSYALDALDVACRRRGSDYNEPRTLLSDLKSAQTTIVPAVGEGEDVRLSGPSLVGAALFARGRTIHLTVFPQA